MSYTPPSLDNINFDMPTSYTPPAIGSIAISIGGVTITTVDCINAPFEVSTQCSPDEAPEWIYPLIPIEGSSDIGTPDLAITLPVPGLECTVSFTGSPQPRVNCLPLTSDTQIVVKGIQEVPEGFTVVSPWPLEMTPSLSMDGVAMVVSDGAFEINFAIGTPAILAGGEMTVDLEPLSVSSSVGSDMFISAVLEPMETGGSQLDVLAIKSMPAGDQYLSCPAFEMSSYVGIPIPLFGFQMPPFMGSSDLSVDSVYLGGISVLEPIQISQELTSLVSAALDLQPLVMATGIVPDPIIDVTLYSSPVEVSSALGVDDIVIGSFIGLPALESVSAVESGIGVDVWLFNGESSGEAQQGHPIVDTALGVPSIIRAVICPAFTSDSEISFDDIKIFNLDFATQFYYFVLTGDGDGTTDIEIPISSFQASRRNGAPSFLQVVIPGMSYVPAINDRAKGTLQVYLTYKLDGSIVRQSLVVDASLDSVRIDEGPVNSSVTLSGHKTETFTPKEIELEGVMYKNITDGKFRYRLAVPSLTLTPGDTATIGGETFSADVISYYFRATRNGMAQNMEVSEA